MRVTVGVGKGVGETSMKGVGAPTAIFGLETTGVGEIVELAVSSPLERQPANKPSEPNRTKTNAKAVNFFVCMRIFPSKGPSTRSKHG